MPSSSNNSGPKERTSPSDEGASAEVRDAPQAPEERTESASEPSASSAELEGGSGAFHGGADDQAIPDTSRATIARAATRLPSSDTETLLYFGDEDEDRELILVLPSAPLPGGESGVLRSAVRALEAFDPLQQQGAIERPLAGVRLLPGLVPLAPVTFGAFFLFSVGMAASIWFSARYASAYLFAFLIVHVVFFAHVWTYHLAYRTRRRFMALRQVFFLALVVTLDWMLLDIIESPPGLASLKARLSDAYATPLWVAFGVNAAAVGAIVSHWLVLGRGHREVSLETGKIRRRVGAPAKVAARAAARAGSSQPTAAEESEA